MKALFVRFTVAGGPLFFGPAIVIPDADYLTILMSQGDRVVVRQANRYKMKSAKILKEFKIDFFTLNMLFIHRAHLEQLQRISDNYNENERRLLRHLRDAYEINLQ